jgi:hypothetical protein
MNSWVREVKQQQTELKKFESRTKSPKCLASQMLPFTFMPNWGHRHPAVLFSISPRFASGHRQWIHQCGFVS